MIALLALPRVQALDVVGPIDVFAEANAQLDEDAYRPIVIGVDDGPLRGTSGLRILPDRTIATAPKQIDTLLVAGGRWMDELRIGDEVVRWLRRRAPNVRRLGSVCSGAFVLAKAGLLDGRQVTTHWKLAGRLAEQHPALLVDPDPIWVRDGRVFTSAGVTAGIDLSLALVEDDFGKEIALAVARQLVVFLKRPGGQSQFSAQLAAQSVQKGPIREVQEYVLGHLAADLSLEALARRARMSERNFGRVFQEEVGTSPAKFVVSARLDAARRLMEDSREPLKTIAADAGFANVNHLRRAFLRSLGVTPSEYRDRFVSSKSARP